MGESTKKKYEDTKMKELNISFENIKEEFPSNRPSSFQSGLIGFYGNDSYLVTNFSLMTEDVIKSLQPKLFLMDKSDVEMFESPDGANKDVTKLVDLETFKLFKPDKKLYLRVFKPIEQGFEYECVFKEEVLTVLPLVITRLPGNIVPRFKMYQRLKSEWLVMKHDTRPTISAMQLLMALTKFDIDLSQITLVNDLSFTSTSRAFLIDGGQTKIRFQNQDGQYMQHPSQAIITSFQLSMHTIDWTRKYIKDGYLKLMADCHIVGQNVMVNEIPSRTATEIHHCFSNFPHLHFNDTIPVSLYVKMCNERKIPDYRKHIPRSDGKMEVYLARAYMIVGWMKQAFGEDPEWDGLRDLMLDGLSFLIPRDKLEDFQRFLKNVAFPDRLYSRNDYFCPNMNVFKEKEDLIARLAAANEKRNQKLLEKKNARKKNTEKIELPASNLSFTRVKPQIEAEVSSASRLEIHQKFAEEHGYVYDEKSRKYVKREDLNVEKKENDVEIKDENPAPHEEPAPVTVEVSEDVLGEIADEPSEATTKNSKKKNKKRKKKEKSPVESEEAAAPEAPEVNGEEAPQLLEQPEAHLEPIVEPAPQPEEPEPAAPRDPNKESSTCKKCFRTSDMCQEALKAAKIAQSKADSFESKAKRTEEVERKMKEMEKEMKEMKIKLATQSKHSEENERLRQKISKREEVAETLRAEKKELTLRNKEIEVEFRGLREDFKNVEIELERIVKKSEDNIQMLKDGIVAIEKNSQQVVNELTTKNRAQQEEITHLNEFMSQKQTELFGVMQENAKLQVDKKLLDGKVKRLENDVQKLREHASAALEPVVFDRRKLIELQKMKDDFGRNTILEEAQEKVDRLKTLPDTTENLPDILESAENELIGLECSIANYQDILDLNVRIYKKSNNLAKLLELPDYPKISERFSEMYSKEFPVRAPVTGIPDSDCLICYDVRKPDEEVQECSGCPYIYHLKCLRTWFKGKPGRTCCPQCQNTLRDPNEYPALG